MEVTTRTVSTDPGLLSVEELIGSQSQSQTNALRKLAFQGNHGDDGTRGIHHLGRKIKEKFRWFLDKAGFHIKYDDLIILATIFVLFGDWIRVLAFSPSSDAVFAVLYELCFVLFIIDIVLNSWIKSDFTLGLFQVKGYMFNFFFWLDLLCLISMIPDLAWLPDDSSHFLSGNSIGAKAGKASRLGVKAGRIVRMARLIRLVKLYKITSQRKRERKIIEDISKLVENGYIDHDDIHAYIEKMTSSQQQSKVGAELSDIITRRVIIAVLLMLTIVPILTSSPSVDGEEKATAFLQSINVQAGLRNCRYLLDSTRDYVSFMSDLFRANNVSKPFLIGLSILPQRCNSSTAIDFKAGEILSQLRAEEIKLVNISQYDLSTGEVFSVESIFNIKHTQQKYALSGIYTTIFVVFMLISLSMQFTSDAQKLVLAPIENMMEMVNMVAADPLAKHDFDNISETGAYETYVVHSAIQKITGLLRVGFGIAGAAIISKNMTVEEKNPGSLETIVPGKRIYAIFGFCDIQAFDYCTEKLEDEIMSFVNAIARIVHDEVTRWGGLCNKNLGNAFLMVWRIGDEDELDEVSGRTQKSKRPSQSNVNSLRSSLIDLRRIPGVDFMADKALIGFLKVLVEAHRDRQLVGYRSDPRLKDSSGAFQLRMGFGLHCGWAIEGAVGSIQKVDATYLSPHVNMTARMEAATRQYKLAILMTQQFHEIMTVEAQQYCRKVDIVTVKGSAIPTPVYTYDTLQNQVFPQLRTPKYSNLRLDEVLNKQAEDYDVSLWDSDADLIQLRRLSTVEFKETFAEGLKHYISGSWSESKAYLERADELMLGSDVGGDGPSQVLLAFMKSNGWTSPKDWKGHRNLMSKGYSTFHLANKKMITHRTRISDPYVSSFDVILRSLEEAASTSNQCSNSTANSTTTNTTCVYGTCRPVFYQNTSKLECACEPGYEGKFCELLTNNSTGSGNHVGLIIFLLLILSIILLFCGGVARVVIKRRIERKSVLSATAALDLEDEIHVV